MEYVLFTLGNEQFGIPVNQVREVLRVPQIIPLPQTPDFIEGVITLRGHSVAVIDLEKRLGVKKVAVSTQQKHVLIVRFRPMIMGIVVERANDVMEIQDAQIDRTSQVVNAHLEGKMVVGIAHVGNKSVVLLDLTGILAPQEQDRMKGLNA